MTKNRVIEILNLKPLSIEGGYFSEVYRSAMTIEKSALGGGLCAPSYNASTSIYFLLGADDVSKMHSVAVDETWHFYASSDSGIFVELVVVSPSGEGRVIKLGSRLELGQVPQFTVPANWWIGARVASEAGEAGESGKAVPNWAWTLTGATVAPSFEYCDFVSGDAAKIAKLCPELSKLVLEIG